MKTKRFLNVVRIFLILSFIVPGLFVFAQEKEWKVGYYPDGKIRYKGYFVKEQPVGEILRYDPEGRLQARMNYEGEKVKALLYSKEGDYVASGEYIARKREGEWIYKQGERLLAREYYRAGKLDGEAINYFSSGEVRERRHWKEGVLSGEWSRFYAGGKLRFRAVWVAGRLEGKVEAYSPEGKLVTTGNYRNGLREGEWCYYKDGQLERKRNYKNGVPEEQELEERLENAELEQWLEEGKKTADPADFTNHPEMYLKITEER